MPRKPPQKQQKLQKPRRFAQQESWTIADWPDTVYPNSCSRAAYVIRANKSSLIAAGALARVGRELVVFGPRYQRWLEMHAANVPDYAIAANRARIKQAAAEA